MKKLTLIFAFASLMFGSAYAQTKGGSSTSTTTTEQASKDKNKDKDSRDRSGTSDKEQMDKKAQEMAKEWTAKMDEVLSLSADQKKKAMDVNEKYARQILEMKMKHKDNPDGMSESQMQAAKDKLTEARLKEYQSFLTKEQAAKFKEHRDGLKSDKEKMSKEEKKEKVENMTPEEREKMKEEHKKDKSE